MKTAYQVSRPLPVEHTIYLEGLGVVDIVPDIATMTFGISSTAKSVAEAQTQNSAQMNALSTKIQEAGIPKEDLQTQNYSAYEKTFWNKETNRSESEGWVVSQSLVVKIRDAQKTSLVIEIAGQNGSTSINGPVFTTDDTSVFEAKARSLAMEQVKKKAEDISSSLGFNIGRVASYNEYKDENNVPMYGMKEMNGSFDGSVPPSIFTGTEQVRLRVNVSYVLTH